jgi:tetratricopeptide (TPR) repeat protein
VATTLESLGSIYKIKGDSSSAEPLMRRALEISTKIHGLVHPSVVSCLEWLVLILKDLNRYDEAVKLKKQADDLQKILGVVGERIAD